MKEKIEQIITEYQNAIKEYFEMEVPMEDLPSSLPPLEHAQGEAGRKDVRGGGARCETARRPRWW